MRGHISQITLQLDIGNYPRKAPLPSISRPEKAHGGPKKGKIAALPCGVRELNGNLRQVIT
jgi:hypothetical protein